MTETTTAKRTPRRNRAALAALALLLAGRRSGLWVAGSFAETNTTTKERR